MGVCQFAEQWLAVPATSHHSSVFWSMAFFSVYWFLASVNLKCEGVRRIAGTDSLLYWAIVTMNLETVLGSTLETTLDKSIFEDFGFSVNTEAE